MTSVVVERRSVCAACGGEFADRSRTSPRSYCYECKPLPSQALEPPPFERAVSGDPFTVPHFRAWSSRFKLKDGSYFELEDFQALFLEDLFARREDGRPLYAELWLIIPEGNGKTTFLALIVLYVIEFVSEAWVPVAASARDQAVDLTYRVGSGFVERNGFEDAYRLHPGLRKIIHRGSRGAAKIFASDAASGDGVDPTLALIEELHRLTKMDLYETWAGKLEKSGGQLVVVSTAGEPGGPFEVLRERFRQEAAEMTRDGCYLRAASEGAVLHEYAIPEDGDAEDLELVVQANPFSGITVETLRRKRKSPSWNLGHWRRFTCNLPTRSDAAAIQEKEWFDAATEERIPEGEPVWVGLDVGWKWDTTAAVPLWVRDAELRLLGPARVLVPPRDGHSLDPNLVEHALIQINVKNPIHTLVMDMSRAETIASWAEGEFGCEIVDRSQGHASAAQDYEMFMDALRNGWLKHSGDQDLTSHALNAIARILPLGDAKFERPHETRNTSMQDHRVIDALVAAAMVHAVAASELGSGEVHFAFG